MEKKLELDQNKTELQKAAKVVDNQRRKLSHKEAKTSSLKASINQHEKSCKQLKARNDKSVKVKVTSTTAKKRQGNPTSSDLNLRAKVTRRNETLKACLAIHGGTEDNMKPAISGMMEL